MKVKITNCKNNELHLEPQDTYKLDQGTLMIIKCTNKRYREYQCLIITDCEVSVETWCSTKILKNTYLGNAKTMTLDFKEEEE